MKAVIKKVIKTFMMGFLAISIVIGIAIGPIILAEHLGNKSWLWLYLIPIFYLAGSTIEEILE